MFKTLFPFHVNSWIIFELHYKPRNSFKLRKILVIPENASKPTEDIEKNLKHLTLSENAVESPDTP